jgi:hypothetical protein
MIYRFIPDGYAHRTAPDIALIWIILFNVEKTQCPCFLQ